MGRGKVELKRIENTTNRQVTFSKRRNGLLKKAFELSVLCDAEVALIIFSPTGKVFQFSGHDMDRTIARYRDESGLPQLCDHRTRSKEFLRTELDDMKKTIKRMEAKNMHLFGEDLLSLELKELKQLERQVKLGVERVRSRQKHILVDHINLLKRKQKSLQEENTYLQNRLNAMEEPNAPNLEGGTACILQLE